MPQASKKHSSSLTGSAKRISNVSHNKPLDEYSPREVGLEGEDIAAAYLERRGYTVLERNWVSNAGEADIVALAPCVSQAENNGDAAFDGMRQTETILQASEFMADQEISPVDKSIADEGVLVPPEVVLIEVKTRLALHDPEDTMPEIAVGKRKQQRYRKIALMYLALHSEYDAVRFDVIAINIVGESLARLRHLIGAFSWED